MKRLFLLLSLFMFLYGHSQISKTINVTNSGSLNSLLTDDEKNTITDLTVNGTIDVRDIKCMRDQLIVLKNIDLSAANIAAYEGVGTSPSINSYASNQMPAYSFRNSSLGQPKITLESIILPNSLISIEKSAFSGCTGLKSIYIGNSITTIGIDAFFDCEGLTTVTMGSSVTTIQATAFEYCYSLINITIGDHVTYIGGDAFGNCKIKKVVFPSSLTTINESFRHCQYLTEVTIPASITHISDWAFQDCPALTTIYSLNTTPPVCSNYCFIGLSGVTSVYVPISSVNAYKSAYIWSDCFYSKIKALTPNAVPDLVTNKVKVYSDQSTIIVEGTSVGEMVIIYSQSGKQLNQITSLGNKIIIPVQNNNIYIVRTTNRTSKIIL
jgi:hypothetical protein